MRNGAIVRAVLSSRLANALEIWSEEVRTTGDITRREIAVLHDLFDTVAAEVRTALADDGPVVTAGSVARLAALAGGLAELTADIRHFQQWTRGTSDDGGREQAACVARRADEFRKLVEALDGRGVGDDGRTGHGLPGVPGAGPGGHRPSGIHPPVGFPPAARPHAGGALHPGTRHRARPRGEPGEMNE